MLVAIWEGIKTICCEIVYAVIGEFFIRMIYGY